MSLSEFYVSEWQGSFDGSDEERERLLSRATDIVSSCLMTADTESLTKNAAFCKAVCAQADYIDYNGGINSLSDNESASVSLGKFSYSSGGAHASAPGTELCPLAKSYLRKTGLLYRGVKVI